MRTAYKLVVSLLIVGWIGLSGWSEILAREGKGYLERQDGPLILHLKGTPYEMGYQHGKLLRDMVANNIRNIIDNRTEKSQNLAYQMYKLLRLGMHARLVKYLPDKYLEEMRGLADGSGLSFNEVLAGNLFPEAFHCSGIALKGSATRDGSLYHVRVLDFMTDMGFQDTAVVMMVEPEGGKAFLNVGFAGFIGSVTGMNEEQITIGEMGGQGQGYWDGLPMSLLVRDALERASTLEEAQLIFQRTPRTCEYYYVISDAKIPDARGVYATPKQLHFMKPGESYAMFNLSPAPADDSGGDKELVTGYRFESTPWQTMIESSSGQMLGMLNRQMQDSVVISGPDRFVAFMERFEKQFGQVDETVLEELIRRPVSMKSNLHNAIFHPSTLEAWVAVAGADGEPACNQPYHHYRLARQSETAVQTTLGP